MSDAIAEAIREHWGEKCGEFEPECPTCQVWAEFAELSRLSALVAWQDIETAPKGQQILVWETDYGWLLACHDVRHGWRLKSSGNFYSEMPASVVSKLTHWQSLPAPPASQLKDTTNADK